jgi:PPOX class probable F420-dependent enzyme
MTELNPAARAVLESDALAHLVTVNPDGSPQVTGVWVGIEDEEIVIASLGRYRKFENVERDPRVALSFVTGELDERGLHAYLVIYGRARITEGGAPEILQRLAHVYMGPDVRFPPMDDPPPGYVMRIGVERVTGAGPWAS